MRRQTSTEGQYDKRPHCGQTAAQYNLVHDTDLHRQCFPTALQHGRRDHRRSDDQQRRARWRRRDGRDILSHHRIRAGFDRRLCGQDESALRSKGRRGSAAQHRFVHPSRRGSDRRFDRGQRRDDDAPAQTHADPGRHHRLFVRLHRDDLLGIDRDGVLQSRLVGAARYRRQPHAARLPRRRGGAQRRA